MHERIFEEVYGISDQATDPALIIDDAMRIDACINRIASCIETGRYDEAIEEGERILPIIRKRCGKCPTDRADYACALATAYIEKKQLNKADALLKREITVFDNIDERIADPLFLVMTIDRAGVLNAPGKCIMARSAIDDLCAQYESEKRHVIAELDRMDEPDTDTGYLIMCADLVKLLCDKAIEKIGTGEVFSLNSLVRESDIRDRIRSGDLPFDIDMVDYISSITDR